MYTGIIYDCGRLSVNIYNYYNYILYCKFYMEHKLYIILILCIYFYKYKYLCWLNFVTENNVRFLDCQSNIAVATKPCADYAKVFYTRPTAEDAMGTVPVYPQEDAPIYIPPCRHSLKEVYCQKSSRTDCCLFF